MLLTHDPLGVQGTDEGRTAYDPYLNRLREALERGEVTGLGPLLTRLHDELGPRPFWREMTSTENDYA